MPAHVLLWISFPSDNFELLDHYTLILLDNDRGCVSIWFLSKKFRPLVVDACRSKWTFLQACKDYWNGFWFNEGGAFAPNFDWIYFIGSQNKGHFSNSVHCHTFMSINLNNNDLKGIISVGPISDPVSGDFPHIFSGLRRRKKAEKWQAYSEAIQ